MKLVIKKSMLDIKNIFVICLFFMMTLVNVNYSFRGDFLPQFVYYEIMFIVSAILLIFYRSKSSKTDYLFILLMLFILVSIGFKHETEYILRDVMIVFAVFVFYYIKETVFNLYVFASCLVVIPYFVNWFWAALQKNMNYTNRGPIHFSVMGLLLLTVIGKRKRSEIGKYFIMGIIVFYDYIAGSRASLLASLLCLIIMVLTDFKDKIPKRRMGILCVGILLFAIVLIFNSTAIEQLLFYKWNHLQNSVFAGRSMMWKDVFGNIRWWGYPHNYIMTKYRLENVHNGYIQPYVSFGVGVGIINLLWIFSTLYKLFHIKNWEVKKWYIFAYIPLLFLNMFESCFIVEAGYPFVGLGFACVSGQIFRSYKMQSVRSDDIHKSGNRKQRI